MATFKTLYDRACRKGKLKKNEYDTDDYIADINDLARTLWTTIFQGVNGNKPKAARSDIITVAGDTEYVHTRTIKKTPILKIVYEDCEYLAQRTDKIENIGNIDCFSFEYDDEEIRFYNSVDGDYEIFYESATYPELTAVTYAADAEPDWIKDDFLPIFWSYPAFLNTDTVKAEMQALYLLHLKQFEDYYSRTETLEENVMTAADTCDQL